MAVLTITVPAANATEYLTEVINQIGTGNTSGHVDATTHWEVSEWDDEAADELR